MWNHSFCHKLSILEGKKEFQRPNFDQHTSLAVLATNTCLLAHLQSCLCQAHTTVPELYLRFRQGHTHLLAITPASVNLIKAAQVRTAPCLKADLKSLLCRLSLTEENMLL